MMEEQKVVRVTNITHSASEADLADMFSVAGDISRAIIIQSGFPYYGFVEYIKSDDAKRGLRLNGRLFGPSKISVDYSNQPFPQQLGNAKPLIGSSPVRGANPRMANTNRLHKMENSGVICTARTPQDQINMGRMLSTGQTPQHQGAMPISNQNENKQIVQLKKPGDDPFQGTTFDVFLSNIPVNMKEHNLHQLFSEFGTVLDANIVLDSSNLSTGRGKVVFSSYESAINASCLMNGKQLAGSNLRLSCQMKDGQVSRPVQGIRQHLSNSSAGNVRHHPYQNNVPYQQQPVSNPHSMLNQGPPPGNQIHQHFDGPNIGGPNTGGQHVGGPSLMGQRSSFNIHGGASHQLTASHNAPVKHDQPAAVYVANLPETTCKNCLLYQLFSPYGAISSVKAMEPKDKKDGKITNWVGFVNYKDISDANVAILTLNKSSLDGNALKVVLKTEKPNTKVNKSSS